MPYFIAISFIFGLRLWIWKLFPGLESGIKDDLSNMIIAGLIFALAIIFFAHKAIRREGLVKSGLEGPIALFVAAAMTSLAWTADMAGSIKVMIMQVAYVCVFYILLNALAVEYQRRIFLWLFFAGSVVVAGYGINDIIVLSQVSPEALESARLTNKSLYYILTHKRACSLFGWPNVLAGFLMLSMPLTAALFMSVRTWWLRLVVALGGVMMVAAFFLTFSFLGWSGFLVTSGLCLGFFIYRRLIVIPPLVGRYLLVGVVLAAILFTGVVLKKNFEGSISPRKKYMRVVSSVISQHPLRGSGFGAYRFASMKFVQDNEGETAFPHNAYAQVWAETGLPGLAAILWLVVLIVLFARRILGSAGQHKDKYVVLAVVTGLAAFLVDNINSFTMLKPNVSFFFWVWLALFCSYGLVRERRFGWKMIAFAVLVAGMGFFLSVRSVLSLSAFRSAREAAQAGIFDLAQSFFDRAEALDPLDPRSLTARGDLYLMAFRGTLKPVWRDEAERVFLKAVERSPHYHYNYLALSIIYNSRGDRLKADAAIEKARAVSPYETERDLQAMSRQK